MMLVIHLALVLTIGAIGGSHCRAESSSDGGLHNLVTQMQLQMQALQEDNRELHRKLTTVESNNQQTRLELETLKLDYMALKIDLNRPVVGPVEGTSGEVGSKEWEAGTKAYDDIVGGPSNGTFGTDFNLKETKNDVSDNHNAKQQEENSENMNNNGAQQVDSKAENGKSCDQIRIKNLEITVSGMKRELRQLRSEVNISRTFSDKIARLSQNVFYGFTAVADSDPSDKTYDNGDRIEYNVAISNLGGWYNPVTYEFTCPVDGIYLFTLSVMSGNQALGGRVSIYKDGNRLVSTWSDGRNADTSFYGHATNVVITPCQQAEKVWVECESNACQIWQRALFGEMSFSGFLLQDGI